MHEAATAYLLRFRWPDGGVQSMQVSDLQKLLRDTYSAGYTSGRESRTPPE
jgi:hypothetical protein